MIFTGSTYSKIIMSALLLPSLLFISCKREYACECEYTDTDYWVTNGIRDSVKSRTSHVSTGEYKKMSRNERKDAEQSCLYNQDRVVSSTYTMRQASCALTKK
jgi:hypothetical protein